MPKFIVKTEEHVTGTYLVEAADEAEARSRFRDDRLPHIDWTQVEQIDYMAYTCEVQSVASMDTGALDRLAQRHKFSEASGA